MSKEPKIVDLTRERADKPECEAVADIAADVMADATLGRVKAIATVALHNGGGVYSATFTGFIETDKLALIGGLHRLIDVISDTDRDYEGGEAAFYRQQTTD